MKELVTLLDAALAANLRKRQWAAFAAVLRQTLGYRKATDDISPRRLEQLTGIQRNHIWQAKNELRAMGLLVCAAGHYGEWMGFPDTLGQRQPCALPSPDLGGDLSQLGHDPVPKQDTTLRNQTNSNHDNNGGGDSPVPDGHVSPLPSMTAPAFVARPASPALAAPAAMAVLDEQALEYPACLVVEERRQAATHLDGLSPQGAQDVLDVLAVMDARGEVRKSRMGLLFALVKAQRQGLLDVSPAIQWRQQRERQRALPLQQDRLESAGEWAWVQQLAELQGLPVAALAAQLGVKMPPPHRPVLAASGMVST